MTYIKLEDVHKIIERYVYSEVVERRLLEGINSLPSINPEAMIEEMMDKFDKEDKDVDSLDDYFMGLSVGKSIGLKRLLQKFKS